MDTRNNVECPLSQSFVTILWQENHSHIPVIHYNPQEITARHSVRTLPQTPPTQGATPSLKERLVLLQFIKICFRKRSAHAAAHSSICSIVVTPGTAAETFWSLKIYFRAAW